MISACGQPAPSPTLTPTLAASATRTPGPTRTVTPTHPRPIGLSASALEGVSLEIWHAFAGAAAQIFTQQVDRFNITNEWGIQVRPVSYSDYPGLFDAANTALEASRPPDLVASLPEQLLAWSANRSIVDLTSYIDDPSWGMDSAALADIPAPFLAQDNVGGAQWGVPAQRTARFLFYNVTWATELGFKDPPRNPEDFRKQACAANASFRRDADLTNDSYGGWIVDTNWQGTYSWLLGFDGSVADGGAYGFRTDPNLAMLQFLKGLYDQNCAWLPSEPSAFDPFDPFSRRLALFVAADLSQIPQAAAAMAAAKNSDQWEPIPYPGLQKPVVVAYGPTYGVIKTTPERQLAAWVFLRWLLSPENQAKWVQATGLLPLRLSSLPSLAEFETASPQWSAAVKDIDLAQGVPQLASWRSVRYILEDGLNTVFQNNTPAAQLPSILTEMDTIAQQLNK